MNTKIGPLDLVNLAFGALGFFFPVVGAVMYFIYKKDSEPKAKSAGIGALAGVAAKIIILAILWFILK